jgi:DNA-binding PadR family transcriptional regulator
MSVGRGRGKTRPSGDPGVLILTSLVSGAKHGYALARDIEEFAGVLLGPGTLYGAITRLEDRGLIESAGQDERRRPYRLTPAGRAELTAEVRNLGVIVGEAARRLGIPAAGEYPGAGGHGWAL